MGIEVRNACVSPVYAHGVLRQIVCADAEEIRFLCKQIRDKARGGGLHHHAGFDSGVIFLLLTVKLFHAFLYKRFHSRDLVDTGDKRKHHPHVAKGACPQQRAKLRLEYVRPFQAEAYRAEA